MKRRSSFFALLGAVASLACGNRCLARATKTQRGPCVHSIDIARSPDTGSSPFSLLCSQIQSDPDYAWGWHCNLAMASVDEGMYYAAANRAAARFMHQFGVDMTQHPNYVAMKPYWEST